MCRFMSAAAVPAVTATLLPAFAVFAYGVPALLTALWLCPFFNHVALSSRLVSILFFNFYFSILCTKECN